jgi:hypothetical protein
VSPVIVYSEGVCFMSVCSSLSAGDTEAWIRENHPSGTSHNWAIAKEGFRNGDPNGRACEDTAGRCHFLLEC